MEYLTPENVTIAVVVLSAIRGAGATIAIHTPNKHDDKFFAGLAKFINIVGGNYGKAKNAE
jgi:hypothetical protein